METINKTRVVKNLEEKSVQITREFNAPLENVWSAFTESELLDQWWGPSPWRAETKSMDFKVGGYWLYAMVGPENQKHWGRMDYQSINLYKNFEASDSFCDENGIIDPTLPVSNSNNVFTKTDHGTQVQFKIRYATTEALQKIIEMGFEQGISICFDQLEELLNEKKS